MALLNLDLSNVAKSKDAYPIKRHSLNVVNGPKLAAVAFRPSLKTQLSTSRSAANCALFKKRDLLNVVYSR